MKEDLSAKLAIQLKNIIDDYNILRGQSKYDDLSDRSILDLQHALVKSMAAIERIAGRSSIYYEHAEKIQGGSDFEGNKLSKIVGIMRSLKEDIEAGYVQTLEELIHSDVFSDFLV
ncbi:MAG: hypothetical protein ABIK83_02505 [Candidatus Zixiibacteriota bacterium]